MSTKILVVDDHEIVREGVRSLLERMRPEWELCGEGSNGEDAVTGVQTIEPDVIVLDISMPIMNGLQAAMKIRKLGAACRILIFTMHESERLIDEVRESGAHGYVVKARASRDLVAAIEVLLAGDTFFGGPKPPAQETVSGGKQGKPASSRRGALGIKMNERPQASVAGRSRAAGPTPYAGES